MFQGFYGLLTVMLCMLFAVVATLFNIAPITYMVFGIAIVLSVLLQYGRFKKRTISERAYNRLACGLFVVIIGESFVPRILWPINGYAMRAVCYCSDTF